MNLKSRDPGLSTPAVTKRDKSSMEVRNRKKRVVGLSGSTGEHGLDFDDLVDRKHQPEGDSKKSKVSGKAVDTEVTPESTTEKKRSAAKPLNQGWADWQRDSADTVRIIAALIIWAAMSFLFFIAQVAYHNNSQRITSYKQGSRTQPTKTTPLSKVTKSAKVTVVVLFRATGSST
eukprot:232753-Amorphochlora_amoeboformis.AAC.2